MLVTNPKYLNKSLYDLLPELLSAYPAVKDSLAKMVDVQTEEYTAFNKAAIEAKVGYIQFKQADKTYSITRVSSDTTSTGFERFVVKLIKVNRLEAKYTNISYRVFKQSFHSWITLPL